MSKSPVGAAHPAPEHPVLRGLRPYAKLVAVATLFLILFGSLVTSHDAGLSVPDWPTSYGYSMLGFPPSKWIGPEYMGYGGIFWEHGHRLLATGVGALSLLLAFWIWLVESRPWVKWLSLYAVAIVMIQGLLGGLTVLYALPTAVSVSHGVLAQIFFLIVIVLAYSQSRERARREAGALKTAQPAVARWALVLLAAIMIQLVFGAWMRHTASGLAIPDFPKMGGQWVPTFDTAMLGWINAWRDTHQFELHTALPPVTMTQVAVHFAHRLGAVVIALVLVGLVLAARRHRATHPVLHRGAWVLVSLVTTQIVLGAGVIHTALSPFVASVHVLFGASILGYAAILALRALPLEFGALAQGVGPGAAPLEPTPSLKGT